MDVVQTLPNDLDEFVEIERFEDGVADRVRRNLVDAALPGRREDDDVGTAGGEGAADLLDELIAVQAGHHEVEENEVERTAGLDLIEAGSAVFGQVNVELH